MKNQYFTALKTILPDVSRETLTDLETYAALLQQWQQHINLIGNATLPDLWQRHILDSVQLFPLAAKIRASQDATVAEKWLDVGSGGGFPGLVLAILAKHGGNVNAHVSLIESNGKKAAFLRMVAVKLGLPVTILNQRIETSYNKMATPDIITARALAELPKLFTLIAPFFGEHTMALLQKGRGFSQEIDHARHDWQFDLVPYPSAINEDSAILAIRNLRPKINDL